MKGAERSPLKRLPHDALPAQVLTGSFERAVGGAPEGIDFLVAAVAKPSPVLGFERPAGRARALCLSQPSVDERAFHRQ